MPSRTPPPPAQPVPMEDEFFQKDRRILPAMETDGDPPAQPQPVPPPMKDEFFQRTKTKVLGVVSGTPSPSPPAPPPMPDEQFRHERKVPVR